MTKARLMKQGVVTWSIRRGDVQQVLAKHYQIHIQGKIVDALLNIENISCSDELTVYLSNKASIADAKCIAIKKDHVLYLNPNLHFKSRTIAGCAALKTWHWLTGVMVIFLSLICGFNLPLSLIMGLIWIFHTAGIIGFKKYRKFLYQVEEDLTHLRVVLGLPKDVDFFYKKYGFENQVAVVDLNRLQ